MSSQQPKKKKKITSQWRARRGQDVMLGHQLASEVGQDVRTWTFGS
jgi:hypothetical protein